MTSHTNPFEDTADSHSQAANEIEDPNDARERSRRCAVQGQEYADRWRQGEEVGDDRKGSGVPQLPRVGKVPRAGAPAGLTEQPLVLGLGQLNGGALRERLVRGAFLHVYRSLLVFVRVAVVIVVRHRRHLVAEVVPLIPSS